MSDITSLLPALPPAVIPKNNYLTVIPAYFFSFFSAISSIAKKEAAELFNVVSHHPGIAVIQSLFVKAASTLGYYYSAPAPSPKESFLRNSDFIKELLKSPEESSQGENYLESYFNFFQNAHLDPNIDEEIFKELFTSDSSEKPYLIDHFAAKYNMPQALKKSLEENLEKRKELEDILAKKDEKKLLELAQKYEKDIKGLPPGKKLIFSQKLLNGNGLSELLQKYIGSQLPNELGDALFEKGDNKVLADKLYERISEHFKKEIGQDSAFTECQTHIRQMVAKAMKATLGRLPGSWENAIKNSLKEDFNEIASGSNLKKVWEMLSEEGLEKIIKSSFGELTKFLPKMLNNLSQGMNSVLSSAAPTCTREIFSSFGLGLPEHITIEIEKGENGKYALTIFLRKTDSHEDLDGLTAPLVYLDINESDLNTNFFYRIFAFEAWPLWKGDVRYSIDDFLEVFASLNARFQHSNFVNPDIKTKKDLLFFLLRYHLNLSEDAFEKELLFLRQKALVSIWKNKPDLQSDKSFEVLFEKALDTLSSSAISLHKKGLIKEEELNQIYLILKYYERKKERESPLSPSPNFLLPPPVENFVKELIPDGIADAETKSFLKEMFVDIFGEEVLPSLDYTLKAIEKERNGNLAPSPSPTWGEIFSLEGVKKELSDLKNLRISFLHAYRLFAKVIHAVYKFLEISLTAAFLEGFLTIFFPTLSLPVIFAISFISVTYGPAVLKKIVPKSVYDLLSLLTFHSDLAYYIKGRLCHLFYKSFINYLLGSDNISHVISLIKSSQQKLTKDGSIDFHVKTPHLRKQFVSVNEMPTVNARIYHFKDNDNLPRPDEALLLPETIKETLYDFSQNVKKISPLSFSLTPPSVASSYFSSDEEQALYYLNKVIRRLPIPKKNDDFWSKVKNVDEILEILNTLSLMLELFSNSTMTAKGHLNFDVSKVRETIVSFHSLYAIIDYLSRRALPELDESYKPNGCNLIAYVNSPGVKIEDPKTYQQLSDVCEYFGFDLKKRYSLKEIDQRRKECLFNYEKNSGITQVFYGTNYTRFYPGSKTIKPSKEDQYYLNLLKKEEIQKILEAELGPNASDHEKFFYLFHDPSLSEAVEGLKKFKDPNHRGVELIRSLRQARSKPSDPEKGLLDRPFSILRRMYWRATSMVIPQSSSEVRRRVDQTYIPDSPKVEVSESRFYRLIDKVYDFGAGTFHLLTLGKWRYKTTVSLLGFEHFTKENSALILENEVTRESRRGRYPTSLDKTQEVAQKLSSQMSYALEVEPRDQEKILRKPSAIERLTEEQQKVFEMIYSNKSDQIMRTLAFFNQNLLLLSDPNWRAVFKILIQNIGALQSQLEDHPVAKKIAAFFKSSINFFISLQVGGSSDWDTIAMDLILASNWVKNYSLVKDPKAALYFPSERELILEKIIPAIKRVSPSKEAASKSVWKALRKLSLCYLHNPRPSDEAIVDLCRTFYSLKKYQPDNDDAEVSLLSDLFWELKPYILKKLEDRELKRKVVEALLLDESIPLPPKYNGIWNGTFPNVECMGLKIEFNDTDKIGREEDFKLVEQFFQDPGSYTTLSQGQRFYPKINVLCDISGSKAKLIKYFEGRSYALLNADSSNDFKKLGFSNDILLWAEENPTDAAFQVLLTNQSGILLSKEKGRWQETASKRTLEILGNYTLIDSSPCRQIELEQNDHGLSLLSWFVPLKEITAFLDLSTNMIKKLDISSLGLVFNIERKDGTDRAYTPKFPGYFIDENQKDPLLRDYPNHLILKNDLGEKKVILLLQPLQLLWINFFTKMGNFSAPFVQSLISNLINNDTKKYFVYDYKDALNSSNIEALTYLLLLHLINGKTKEIKEVLSEIESISKCYPFPEKVFKLLDTINIFLLTRDDPLSTEIALRIGALRSENELVQHGDEPIEKELYSLGDNFDFKKSAPLVEYFLLQKSYSAFLAQKNARYFTESQELFILKRLSSFYLRFFTLLAHINTDAIAQVLGYFGIDNLANSLFMPKEVFERFQALKTKYHEDTAFSNALDLFSKFNEMTQRQRDLADPELARLATSKSSFNATAFKVATKLAKFYQHPFSKWNFTSNINLYYVPNFDTSEATLETLSLNLWDLTPENFGRYFPLYYRLARKEVPEKWKKTPKETLFLEKARAFEKTMALMQGHYSGDIQYLILFLKAALSTSKIAIFPKAETLDAAIKKAKEEAIKKEKDEATEKEKANKDATKSAPAPETVLKAVAFTETIFRFNPKNNELDTVMDSIYQASKIVTACINFFDPSYVQFLFGEGIKKYGASIVMHASGLGAIDWIYRLRNVPSLIWRLIHPLEAEPEQMPSADNAIQRKKPAFPETLKFHLTQREKNIDDFLEVIKAKYFKKKQVIKREKAQAKALNERREDESETDFFEKINQDLKEFYARGSGGDFEYEFIGNRDEFSLAMEDLRGIIGKRIKYEQDLIVNLASLRDFSAESHILNRGHKYTFDEIFSLFARNRENQLLTEGFSLETVTKVREGIFLLLVLTSRFNTIFDKYSEIGSTGKMEEMGLWLDRKRAYKFEGDERLVRGELLFETAMRVLVWEKQHLQLQQMLQKEQSYNYVLEAIMASGKTFFMIPETANYMANGSLVINVFPTDVVKANISNIRNQSRKAYSQTASAFYCDRNTKWSKANLDAFLQVLSRTANESEHLNTTDKSLQSFELQFLEKALKLQPKTNFLEHITRPDTALSKEEIESHRKVLSHIRSAHANIDEPHELCANPKTELIFPFGEKKYLPDEHIDIMQEVMHTLVSSKEFEHLLTIKSKKPTSLSPEVYKSQILPLLARKIALRLDISSSNLEQFISYLLSNEKTIPAFVLNHKKRSLFGLVKGLLTVILPTSLERIIHRDFDSSQKGASIVKPAKGNKNTLENTTFRNPFEAYVKTCLVKLNDRLNNSELSDYISHLKNAAYRQAKIKKCFPIQTPAAKKFKEITGFDLFNYSESDSGAIFSKLKESDYVTIDYVSKFMAKNITYFGHNLRSDSYTFASMFNSNYSFDGSPHKTGSFPEKTQILFDKGTKGQSVHMIQRCCKAIHVFKNEDPNTVLDELINVFFAKDPNLTAIIDRGAIFNGLSNETVARKILSYVTTHRPDIQGVVFYSDQKELVILEKGSIEPILLKDSRIPPEKRISYFDESHTYAADIAQKDNAVAVVSIGEFLTLEELFQAIWRMRKLGKQSFIFAMTKTVKNLIAPNKDTITTDDIIEFAARNEYRINAEYNYLADRQKISNFIRRHIMDKILFAKDIDTALLIIHEFKDFLLEKIEDDPFNLYGGIDELVPPSALLENLKIKLFKLISPSPHFTPLEKAAIKKDLALMGKGVYPKTTHAYKKDSAYESAFDDLEREVQVETEASSNREREVATEVNVETNVNRQTLSQEQEESNRDPAFWPWPKTLIPHETSWLKTASYSGIMSTVKAVFSPLTHANVPIYSLQDVLKNGEDKSLKQIASSFSPDILATSNMLQIAPGILSGKVEPFSKYQKPLFEVLVIEKGSKKQILLLDQKEAGYWREKLREDRLSQNSLVKFALYDIQNRSIVAMGKNAFSEDELEKDPFLQSAVAQLCFLNGQVKYENDQREILSLWIKKCGSRSMEALFKRFHSYRGIEEYEDSDIEEVFLAFRPQAQLIKV